MIVNPGPIGAPGYEDDPHHRVEAGTPHACHAILDRKGDDWSITFRRIPYDKTWAIARAKGHPDWTPAFETGWLPQA